MNTHVPTLEELPPPRRDGRPLDLPDQLRRLREEHPVARLVSPGGHLGWLVTGHAALRAVLADNRFSARLHLQHPPVGPASPEPVRPEPPGLFLTMDPPDHTRYRRLLAGLFTARRMEALAPRIERITADRLDAMAARGTEAELVEDFALPIPSLVICELLGVPYGERERFQRDTAVIAGVGSTAEETGAAVANIGGFLAELVAGRRADLGDDLISALIRGGGLSDEELVGVALVLLIGGHETTANMLSLGTLALLTAPDQLAALRGDPSLIGGAVEELLRYLSIIRVGPVRTALEDVELDGRLIRAGETVTVSVPAANRDAGRFAEPDRLDITRRTSGHVAFGHGVHQCIGQHLARVELRIGLRALLARFPALRLAVPLDRVRFRTDAFIYGVHELPVAWGDVA